MSNERELHPIVPPPELEEWQREVMEGLGARTRAQVAHVNRRINAPIENPVYDFPVTSTPIGSRLATCAETQLLLTATGDLQTQDSDTEIAVQ